MGLDIKDDKQKCALLLHCSGELVNYVFDTLPDSGNQRERSSSVVECLTRDRGDAG